MNTWLGCSGFRPVRPGWGCLRRLQQQAPARTWAGQARTPIPRQQPARPRLMEPLRRLDCSPGRRRSRAWGVPGAARYLLSFFGGTGVSSFVGMRARVASLVMPRNTKHISLSVCSPKNTQRGGVNGLFGLAELLSYEEWTWNTVPFLTLRFSL